MRPSRRGVATYLQTFVLIAIALGGSLVAYREVSAYANAAGGTEIGASDPSIRQYAGIATERLTISNQGTSTLPFIELLNPGLPASTRYCYTVASTSGALIIGTCPAMSADPTAIRIAGNFTSGKVVIVTVIMLGSVITPGVSYSVVVTAPGAAASSQQVVAVPG